jgi:hypothetical protein
VESRPVETFRDGIHLAVVDARVQVAQRLGDRLDALIEGAGEREERPRGLVVAGLVGGHEILDRRHELTHLILDEGRVQVDGLALLLRIGSLDRDAITGDGERGLADALADHARLAEREVVARLCDHGEGARSGRCDVLDLTDDAQSVFCQQVELRHLPAVVGDLEGEGAALGGAFGDDAVTVGRGDVERGTRGDVGLRNAAAEDEGCSAGCGDRPEDPVGDGHAAP